ncbi:MAG: hypothetical protein JXX29_12115 [Deltaproteobacteria bacterium]|nr:hypothetical protein [Deltaproteobacteria bacterium]MBN2672418.1 hypothetical protein [Deltaproteobacteria bacterium]
MNDSVTSSKQSEKEMFIAIFLLGFICLMMELIQVKMLSFFIGSISNFIAIPIALFGLALGSLFCHFFYHGDNQKLIRVASNALFPVLAATFILFFMVANTLFPDIHIAFASPPEDAAKLFTYSAMFLPGYFVCGVLLTTYFSIAADQIGKLYFFDLTGAALGCLVTSMLFTYTDLPIVVLVLLMACLGLMLNTESQFRPYLVAGALASMMLLLALSANGVIFDEHPNTKRLARTLHKKAANAEVVEMAAKWNHLARTGIYRLDLPGLAPDLAPMVIVQDDGVSNVGVIPYNPELDANYYIKRRVQQPIAKLLGYNPEKILVMFAGAGKDMVQLDALHDGKADITGVELNDLVREMALTPGAFGMNLKRFFEKPNIHYVIREGRDFLNADKRLYDVIFVATNGSVYANRTGHTRKYLDTYQACAAYLDHMKEDGLIVFTNQPVERKLESFARLFKERNLGDFSKSVYSAGVPNADAIQTAYIKLGGLSEKDVEIIRNHHRRLEPRWQIHYDPYGPKREIFKKWIEIPVEKRDGDLITDDKPFIRTIDFAGFRLFPSEQQLHDQRYASNWIKVFTVIMFALVSLLVIGVARFLGPREGRLPLLWLTYFFVSGISYMGVEIGLIAKTELFTGNPLYAVAIILASFLMSNGIGAMLQDKYHVMKGPLTLLLYTAISIAWGVAMVELLNTYMLSVHIALKVLLVFVAVVPSGVCLGMYYPLGVQTLVDKGKEKTIPVTYGAATLSSVLGSSAAATLIINFGFSTIIIAGGLGYALAAGVYYSARRFA